MQLFLICNVLFFGPVIQASGSPSCDLATLTSSSGSIDDVICNAEKLRINFLTIFYQDSCLASTSFTVGEANISGCPQKTVSVGQGYIEYDIDDCVIIKTSTTEELTFALDVEINYGTEERVNGLIISDTRSTSKWSANCTFDRINNVEANYSVSYSPPSPEQFNETVTQEFKLKMETFSTDAYTTALSYPISKSYLQDLFFQISFDDAELAGQSSNFHLITESCWATPDIDDILTNNATLIENECVVSAVSSIVDIVSPQASSNVDQWSSQVFRFPNEDDTVIRCQVRICYDSADCVRDCQNRRRRSNKLLGGNNLEIGNTFEQIVSTGLISIKNEVAEDGDKSAGVTACYAMFLIFVMGFSM